MNPNDNPWSVLTLLVGCISILVATRLEAGPLVSPFSISMIMLIATRVLGDLPDQLWIGFNVLVAAIVLLKLAGLLTSKKKNEGLTPIRPLEISKR
ncbi:hypothetical protein [Rhodococcus sp. As11]|uniref:hypothetical protein n=1 Tax=Rhodococcus sp. As11 TaxID=3029189 RepID=UPI003B787648